VPIHHEIESPIFYDHHNELDQFHTFESPIDKLESSHFYEIEPNEKCDLDSQICDPVQIPKSILTPILLPKLSNFLESVSIPTPVILELESPILDHIPLLGNECELEFQLLDLDPLPEPISTPEALLDLNHFPESVLVPVLSKSRSIIPSFHTPFWDKGIDKIDSEIICKVWKLDGVNFLIKIVIYISF